MSIKRIINHFVFILIIFVLILTGCDKRHDVTMGAETSSEGLNSEQFLSSEDYSNLSNLLGNLTAKELTDVLDGSLKTLNALADQGYTSPDDYQTLLNIITNLYNMMLDDKAKYEETAGAEGVGMAEASDALVTLLTMAAEKNVGEVLNQLLDQTGPDVLTENIYPMLAYVMAADIDPLEGALGGITLPDINKEDFNDIMAMVHDALAEGGLLDTLIAKLDEFKEGDSKITVGDIKAIINTTMDVAGTGTATEDILYSTSLLLGNKNDDLSAILDGVQGLLDPDVVDRDAFKEFVENALNGLAPTADAETLKGVLRAISHVDPAYIPGLADGIAQLITRNMYGQPLTEHPDVITSELRTLIFMMDRANYEPSLLDSKIDLSGLDLSQLVTELWNMLQGIDPDDMPTIDELVNVVGTLLDIIKTDGLDVPVLSLMTSPDGGTVDNYNMAQWTVGEVVTAIQWFRDPSNAPDGVDDKDIQDWNNDGEIDEFDAFDWVLYQKRYTILNLNFLSYDGIVGLMTDPIVKTLMKTMGLIGDDIYDAFPAFVELAGGDSNLSWEKDRFRTAGSRHQIFALFAPLMEYFWDEGRTGDMIGMLANMNEINDYTPLSKGESATFRTDDQGVVLKTLEPVLATLMNPRAPDDKGIVGPALDIVVRILSALDSEPAHDGTTLLDAIMFELKPYLNLDEDTQQEILDALFGEDSTVLDDVKTFLEENRDTILDISGSLSDIDMDAFTELIDYFTEEDNDLVNNTKILVCKVLDLYDKTYNPSGSITDDSTLKDSLITLLGDGEEIDGIYDLTPLKDFLLVATENPDILWTALHEGGDMLDRVLGDEKISLSFMKALFTSVDVDGDGMLDDSVVLAMLKLIHLEGVDMNGLLHELVGLLSGTDLKPGSDTYDLLLNALKLVVENSHITNW